VPSEMPPFAPAVSSAADQMVSAHPIIAVRTAGGTQLYQFPASDQITTMWTRESHEVSRCELAIPTPLDNIPDLVPWLHWVDVWDDTGSQLYWSGPIQQATIARTQTSISARDMASLFTRTRCPMTKKWDITDPAFIAQEFIEAMVTLHGLNVQTQAYADPLGDQYDYSSTKDAVMLSSTIDDLVNLGLHWTVVSGIPLLGPMPRKPIASFNENDFVGDALTIVRDGTASFNDVVVRVKDAISQAIVPMGGLQLQTIVNVDSVSSVSNADRAAKQYVRYTGSIKDAVTMPNGAVLHPSAPVDISQLIPSTRYVIEAFGVLANVELTRVEVNHSVDAATVNVTMVAVDDELPELITLQQQKKPSTTNLTAGLGSS